MISTGQIKMLWSVARQKGFDSEMLHARIYESYGKTSVKELTKKQGAELIDSLQGKKQHYSRASNAQVGVIRGLAKKMGWEDPQRLRMFIRKRYGVERPEWMTPWQAIKAIEALKAMYEGGRWEAKEYKENENP